MGWAPSPMVTAMSNPYVPLAWFFAGQFIACVWLLAYACCRAAALADGPDRE